MKFFLFLLISFVSLQVVAQKATDADITKALKAKWEKPGDTYHPKETITINEIKLGTAEKSNYAQQLDGVPKDAMVTHAKIDFTQFVHYTNEKQATRRIMTALVYKDQFGDWTIMNIGVTYPQK